jgi:hypothetical protein
MTALQAKTRIHHGDTESRRKTIEIQRDELQRKPLKHRGTEVTEENKKGVVMRLRKSSQTAKILMNSNAESAGSAGKNWDWVSTFPQSLRQHLDSIIPTAASQSVIILAGAQASVGMVL